MHHRRRALEGIVAVLALATACQRELIGPVGSATNRTIVTIPVVSTSKSFSGKQARRGSSAFQCVIVAKHPDGKYRKGTGYLSFPASMRGRGATRVVSIEWRPDGVSAPAMGANCEIPDSPEAARYLLQNLLYIDPKTARGNAMAAKASKFVGGTAALNSECCTLPNVTITAQPNFPYSWYVTSGPDRWQDNQLYYPSIPVWTDPIVNYQAPGFPCNDEGLPGMYLDATPLTVAPEVACPKTEFESLCIDLYIAQCTAGGFVGDCRLPDPYAPPGASRAQIVVPTSFFLSHLATTTISESCLALSTPRCRPPLDTNYNRVQVAYVGDDTVAVTFELRNSFEGIGGGVSIGPAINGSVMLVRTGSTWSPTWSRDAFPSMSIVKSSNGVNSLILQRDETKVQALFDAWHWTDRGSVCVVF